MSDRPTKATDAPTKHAAPDQPDPNKAVLRYTGKGIGAWLYDVPARDLTLAEVKDLATRKIATAHALVNSGCYEEI